MGFDCYCQEARSSIVPYRHIDSKQELFCNANVEIDRNQITKISSAGVSQHLCCRMPLSMMLVPRDSCTRLTRDQHSALGLGSGQHR